MANSFQSTNPSADVSSFKPQIEDDVRNNRVDVLGIQTELEVSDLALFIQVN